MATLLRPLCLLLALALVTVPLGAVRADDAGDTAPPAEETVSVSDTPAVEETTNPVTEDGTAIASEQVSQTQESDQVSTSEETQADTEVSSESDTVASSTEETVTTLHEEMTASSTPTEEEASTTPVFTDTASSTEPLGSLATTSQETVGTTTTTSTTSPETTDGEEASSTTAITTGTATAGANVANVTDSSFVNSSGEVVLGNYFASSSDIDLRNATSAFSTGSVCLWFACTGSEGVSLSLTGTSTITNLLALEATTGGNTIQNASSASIATGDALVGLNLVNLANLNVVDSRYFIAALNLFRGLNGDLVFPSLDGFFNAVLTGAAPGTLALNSTAQVDNQIGFDTGTGGNTTSATSSAITTGATHVLGNILNDLNASLVGGANLAILLRVTGAWNGTVVNAPDGLSIIRADDGSIYLTASGGSPAPLSGGSSTASSSALIVNHANLIGQTGGNGIYDADSAQITTGDAYAAANVLTVANQNIIGRNWLTAIVNIFGDWNGDLAFGRPDLWVGERVSAQGAITDGQELTITFTVANKGDAPASNVTLNTSFDTDHLELLAGDPATLGTLTPGASSEVTYRVRVHAAPGTSIETSGTASAAERDNTDADNTDHVTITTAGGGGGTRTAPVREVEKEPVPTVPSGSAPVPVVSRTTITQMVGSTRSAHEELTITNPSDATSTPYDLHDLVKDPTGTVIDDEAWPIGSLAPHEEVRVSYDLTFAADAPVGVYLLSTVLASDAVGDTEYRDNGSIIMALAPVASVAGGAPSAGTPTSTTPVLTEDAPATTTVPAAKNPEGSPLLAAAGSAVAGWPYALGFAGASAVLALVFAGLLALRRRLFDTP